jgi:hypothetical protein
MAVQSASTDRAAALRSAALRGLAQHLAPDARRARGWAGEGSGARTPGSFEETRTSALRCCKTGLRARRTMRPSPSLSFFPGVAPATGASTLQPPARTIEKARRQRPSLSRRGRHYRRRRQRGDWPRGLDAGNPACVIPGLVPGIQEATRSTPKRVPLVLRRNERVDGFRAHGPE